VKADFSAFINSLFRNDNLLFSPYIRSFFLFAEGEKGGDIHDKSGYSEDLDVTKHNSKILTSIDEE